MERTEIVEKVKEIFEEVFNEDEFENFEELGTDDIDNWGSLTHMILLTRLEEEFSIKFKLKELKTLVTVKEIIASIQEKL